MTDLSKKTLRGLCLGFFAFLFFFSAAKTALAATCSGDICISQSMSKSTIYPGDSYSVIATITNSGGSAYSDAVQMYWGYAPNPQNSFCSQNYTVSAGGSTSVSCQSSGDSSGTTVYFQANTMGNGVWWSRAIYATTQYTVATRPVASASISGPSSPVSYNSTASLTVSSQNSTNCSVAGGSGGWYTHDPYYSSGTWITGNLTSNKTFTVACTPNSGTTGTPSASVTIQVNQPVTYNISASAGTGGSVSCSGCGGSISPSAQITVNASPNSSYQFASWSWPSGSNPCASSGSSCTFYASQSGTLTANFSTTPPSFSLSNFNVCDSDGNCGSTLYGNATGYFKVRVSNTGGTGGTFNGHITLFGGNWLPFSAFISAGNAVDFAPNNGTGVGGPYTIGACQDNYIGCVGGGSYTFIGKPSLSGPSSVSSGSSAVFTVSYDSASTPSYSGYYCGSGGSLAGSSGNQFTCTYTNSTGSTFGASAGVTVTQGGISSGVSASLSVLVPSYTLAVSKTGSGTVTGGGINCGGACSISATSGTVVALSAAPSSGYRFSNWSGDCSGSSCSLTMSGNRAVTANFTQITLSGSLSADPNPVVVGNPTKFTASVSGNATGISYSNYSCGGGTRTGILGNTFTCSYPTAGTYTGSVTISSSEGVATVASGSVTVSVPNYTLTVAKTGSGTVTGSGIDCGATCSKSFPSGTSVTLTATPASGYERDINFGNNGWSGCSSVARNDCTVTVTSSQTVTAAFVVPFNYSLSNPGIFSLPQGQSGSSPITTTLVAGVAQPVTLSVSGLPSGVTASFSPNPVTPSASSEFTLTASTGAALGNYPIVVTGSPLGKSTALTLTITQVSSGGTRSGLPVPTGANIAAVFTVPGRTNWPVPQDVKKIKVKVWGAGGSGGYGFKQNNVNHGGAGGGGGGYAEGTIEVSPNTVYTINVGEGGKFITNGSKGVAYWDVVPAGNSEFSLTYQSAVYVLGAGGGGSGGSIDYGITNGTGIAGKGYGGVQFAAGSGFGGSRSTSNCTGNSYPQVVGSGGGGGGGYFVGYTAAVINGVLGQGTNGDDVVLRGCNVDSGSGEGGASGGSGGLAGRCGRNGGGHGCTDSFTIIPGVRGSSAQDGFLPGGGGGGASTGVEERDTAGYGANGRVVIEIVERTQSNLTANTPTITDQCGNTGPLALGELTVTGKVNNAGSSATPDGLFSNRFEWRPGRTSVWNTLQTVPLSPTSAIAAGGSRDTAPLNPKWTPSIGTFDIRLLADSADAVREANEADNTSSVLSAQVVDFTPTLSANPTTLFTTQSTTLTPSVTGTAAGTVTYSNPSCGANASAPTSFNATAGTFKCTYTVAGTYAPSMTVSRAPGTGAGATNVCIVNTKTATLTPSVTVNPQPVDLVVLSPLQADSFTRILWKQATAPANTFYFYRNSNITISGSIKNQGTGKITGAFTNRLEPFTLAQTSGSAKQMSSLDAGVSATYSYTLTNVPDGTYKLHIFADSGDMVKEADETNNHSQEVTIIVEPHRKPDVELYIGDCGGARSMTLFPGNKAHLCWTVKEITY